MNTRRRNLLTGALAAAELPFAAVAPATDGSGYAARFAGKRTHRVIKGVGHNLPQEAPQAFAQAVIDVDDH